MFLSNLHIDINSIDNLHLAFQTDFLGLCDEIVKKRLSHLFSLSCAELVCLQTAGVFKLMIPTTDIVITCRIAMELNKKCMFHFNNRFSLCKL